jgi:hypothetical protein
MRTECNPTSRRGERNLFCTNYNYCLDKAVANSWHSWNCHKCKFRYKLSDEGQNLIPTREEISEYGLTVSLPDINWGLHDNSVDSQMALLADY